MLNEDKIKEYIREELSKSEVRNLIDNKLANYIKEKEFESKVNDIISDVFERFFKMMYNKRGFWKNDIKR